MADDKIGVEVKPGSVAVSASGKAARRLGTQLADLISPFSGTFGLVGDHLQNYRQICAIKALVHAKQLAEEAGLEIHPVHPKFLLTWTEKASLEDDDELSKKWGNLLLSSMGDFDNQSIWAANILSEMGPDDALFLDRFALKIPNPAEGVPASFGANGTIEGTMEIRGILQKANEKISNLTHTEVNESDLVSRTLDFIWDEHIDTKSSVAVCRIKFNYNKTEIVKTIDARPRTQIQMFLTKGLVTYRSTSEGIVIQDKIGLSSELSTILYIEWVELTEVGQYFLNLVSPPAPS